jgi:hypothetical protein
MLTRIAGNVRDRRRHLRRFLLASPLVIAYLLIWSAGEGFGYVLGGGGSLLEVR